MKSPKKNSTNHQKINCFLNMWPSVKSSLISLSYCTDPKHDPRVSECMAIPSRGR